MRRLLLASLLLVSTAAPAAETQLDLARKLMALDGSEEHLRTLAEQIRAQIRGAKARLSEDEFKTLNKSFDRHFDGDAMAERFAETFSKQAREGEFQAALKWYDTPLGKKFTDINRRGTTPEGMKANRDFAKSLEKKPPAASRVALIEQLDKALHLTDLYVDLTANVTNNLLFAMHGTTSKARTLNEFRLNSREVLHRTMLNNFIVADRDLSDEEFRQYIAYVTSKAGHSVFEASFLALDDALRHAAGLVAADMRKFSEEEQN